MSKNGFLSIAQHNVEREKLSLSDHICPITARTTTQSNAHTYRIIRGTFNIIFTYLGPHMMSHTWHVGFEMSNLSCTKRPVKQQSKVTVWGQNTQYTHQTCCYTPPLPWDSIIIQHLQTGGLYRRGGCMNWAQNRGFDMLQKPSKTEHKWTL